MTIDTIPSESQIFRKIPPHPGGEPDRSCHNYDSKSVFTNYQVTQKTLSRLIKRLWEQGLPGAVYVEQYLLDLLRRNLRPNTLRSNFMSLSHFLFYLNDTANISIENMTRNTLYAYIEHEQDRGLKPRSIETKLRSLKTFLKYLIERGIVHPDILKKKIKIKIPDSLPRAIDPDDVKRFLSKIPTVRDRAMFLILLRTGMRIGELLATQVVDINLKEKKIEIFEAQKNWVGRVVYLSKDAMRALRRWLKERNSKSPFLFYGRKQRPLGYEAARIRFMKCMDKARLSHKGYTIHCLRHTFASELLNAGMRLECLQQLLGHESIEMTRRYARLTDVTRKEEYFRAMSLIEKGEIHGNYKFNYKLPAIPEETELHE